jgi:hypothetical protein
VKDAVITVRVPAATRRRIEELACREGRSLSQQVERLIEQGMGMGASSQGARRVAGARSLAGVLQGGRVPALAEFREVRESLAGSIGGRLRRDGNLRR